MSGFQPLVAVAGQIEAVGSRRTEILKLNIGPPDFKNVSTTSFTFSRTMTFVRGVGMFLPVNIFNITGGADGDVLILGGRDARLINGLGNLDLSGNYLLQPGKSVLLYSYNGTWNELNRSP